MTEIAVGHISFAEKRKGIPEFDRKAPCPTCGGKTEEGFGLAGGGYGVYTFCSPCDAITTKSLAPD
jgi:hypothetical protein